jgi:hypothetical protein
MTTGTIRAGIRKGPSYRRDNRPSINRQAIWQQGRGSERISLETPTGMARMSLLGQIFRQVLFDDPVTHFERAKSATRVTPEFTFHSWGSFA